MSNILCGFFVLILHLMRPGGGKFCNVSLANCMLILKQILIFRNVDNLEKAECQKICGLSDLIDVYKLFFEGELGGVFL